MELLSSKVDLFYDAWRNACSSRLQFERQFPHKSSGGMDLSKGSWQDMRAYLSVLTQEDEAASNFLEWDQNLEGAVQTIIGGDLHLDAILTAEKKARERR